MALINFQPNPKIPPIGFFEPISVDPKDMMTDVEYLLGILKKLNEVIKVTNEHTIFIEKYSGKIEEIEVRLKALEDEIESFETEVTAEIARQFAELKVEVNAILSTFLVQANAYTDSKFAILEEEIQDIIAGQITVYDPTTGILSPLQTVIDNLYSSTREEAITATEYDGLELTADTYDDYELTAFNYDKYGKTLLFNMI